MMNTCRTLLSKLQADTVFTEVTSLSESNCLQLSCLYYTVCMHSGKVPIIADVMPPGIEAVNGSNPIMGCTGTLYYTGKLKVCTNISNFISYLTDEECPAVDTSDPNWASELVTVRKSKKSTVLDFPHVLLTFAFEYAVIPESIEVYLFLCPEWQIGAPYITLFGDDYSDMVFRGFEDDNMNSDFILNHYPNEISCHNLSRVILSPSKGEPLYFNWHILVSFVPDESIEWVHTGEVIFNIAEIDSSSKHSFQYEHDISSIEPTPSVVRPSTNATLIGLTAGPSNSIIIAGGGGFLFVLLLLVVIKCCCIAAIFTSCYKFMYWHNAHTGKLVL